MPFPFFREEEVTGQLMYFEPDPITRFRLYIWFDYTWDLINKIKEGDLLAVPNFETKPDESEKSYSILEITNILPWHYAMPPEAIEKRGFPGFLMEAVKNAAKDWTSQVDEPYEDSTKIICEAIPLNLNLKENVNKPSNPDNLDIDRSIPMPGREIKILSKEFTRHILNKGVGEREIRIGHLERDPEVEILLRTEDLLRTHFGIFGYTGVGKSNLVSTTVHKLLNETDENVQLVVFDLMGEYTGLLLDDLLQTESAFVICVDEETLAQPVFEAINSSHPVISDPIAELHLDTIVLPKGLKARQEGFIAPIRELLEEGKVRLFDEQRGMVVDDLFTDEFWGQRQKGGKPYRDLKTIVGHIFGKYYKREENLTPELALKLGKELKDVLNSGDKELSTSKVLSKDPSEYEVDFSMIFDKLREIVSSKSKLLHCGITLEDMITILNDGDNRSLFVVTAHSPDNLRRFSNKLGIGLFEERRQKGKISPLVSFVFDESDEFIPQNPHGTYKDSSEVVATLARRGRKFGIGIGIATQRIIYLDTSIMAQPHTYFVSKLPRKSDRDRIAEAFGITENMFQQTFKFGKGDWLLVSHDATGLESVPFPIHAENAEERLQDFLRKFLTQRDKGGT